MKKHFFVLAAMVTAGQAGIMRADAQTGPNAEQYSVVYGTDSVRMYQMESVSVTSTRAGEKTPMAFTDIGKAAIERNNTGVDMPFLLLNTPSLVVTSDAGAGVGYTGVRIRGSDATRINVTANGIPMNDAESHGMFWVNMPDLASSVEDIQVQRGVGTSTNGAGAFGGSINLKTQALASDPYGEVSASYGSFNTNKQSVNFGTGLIGGKWAFNTRLSHIESDGYIDRASANLKSYFIQGGYYGKSTTVKFITFGGKEKTYLAWEGLSKADMKEHGRKWNTAGIIEDANKNRVGFYKNQTDNYKQRNYQLLITQRLADRWNLNVNLHYTDGYGYYEQYKNRQYLIQYGLSNFELPNPGGGASEVERSNLVRRKIMDNGFGGGVFSLDYKSPRLQASLGGGANKYDGDHFGNVIWVQNYANDQSFQPDHEYYNNKGKKTDANVYMKASWEAASNLYLYGDVQYRHINYKINGTNDKWDDAVSAMQPLQVDKNYNFFNPKAGITYDFHPQWSAYASFAMTHKEPTRNNFTDAEQDEKPVKERLMDYEAGINYRSGIFSAGVNLYYMDYKDQLILTGKVNHIGEALATNIPDSYRTGIEIMAGVQPTRWLRWDVNATFSRNKIKHYTDHVQKEWGSTEHVSTYLGTTTIAYSPKILFNSLISANFKGVGIYLQSNFVGRQYINNSESKWQYADNDPNDRFIINSYFVNNLRLDYTFKLPSLRSVTAAVNINNIFDKRYSSNAYGWVAYDADTGTRTNNVFYFPQAGTNVLASISIKF